jgi:hypothetical protein
VKSPNGVEVLESGKTYNLIWSAENGAAYYTLWYYDGVSQKLINGNVVGTSYAWQVPVVLTTQTNWYVVVKAYDVSNSFLDQDPSDGVFSVIPSVTLTAPNGGELFTSGQSTTIRWSPEPLAAKYSVWYYDGVTWSPVAENVVGTSLNWIVPVVASPQGGCKISVKAYDSNSLWLDEDVSNNPFNINPN